MSRDILKGDLERFVVEYRGTYQTGKKVFDAQLMEDVLNGFFEHTRVNDLLNYRLSKSNAEGIIRDGEMDGQAFLDHVILRISESDIIHQGLSGELINGLVSALYMRGDNGLVLDFRAFRVPEISLGERLRGYKDRPLSLGVILAEDMHAKSLGWDASHCIFRVQGKAVGGYFAQNCTYMLEQAPERIGLGTKESAFYISNISEGMREDDNGWSMVGLIDGAGIMTKYSSVLDSNRFFIPDGKGDWKEVLAQ